MFRKAVSARKAGASAGCFKAADDMSRDMPDSRSWLASIPRADARRLCGWRRWRLNLQRAAASCVLLLVPLSPALASDPVTGWMLLADAYGRGAPNWRTLAIMHQAMHDALNAAEPTYGRWHPPAADEPPAVRVLPEVAMAAAARRVLFRLHPDQLLETQLFFKQAVGGVPEGSQREASIELGNAIGLTAVARREKDGSGEVESFVDGSQPGAWRATPAGMQTSSTTNAQPFMFPVEEAFSAPPPPPLDSESYRNSVDEVRRLGAFDATERTDEQTEAAIFWASQSSQRGYLHLAVRLLDEHPRLGGTHEHARLLSQLASAMADSGILTWHAKEHFNFWRPVTAIREGSPGMKPTPWWMPMLETPPFPEYPSGHAVDCFVGAYLIEASFGAELGSVTYVSHRGDLGAERLQVFGMGQHAQAVGQIVEAEREFPTIMASAEECAESRIWAGAHFRPGIDEARRLGQAIAEEAMASLPPLDASQR